MLMRLWSNAKETFKGAAAKLAGVICNANKEWNEIVCGKVGTVFDAL